MSLNHHVKELKIGLVEEEDDDDDEQQDHRRYPHQQDHELEDHDILSSLSDIETPNWLRDEPTWLRDHEVLLDCKNSVLDHLGSNGLSTRLPSVDHIMLSENCFSGTLLCKDNCSMEGNIEPHNFGSCLSSSFQHQGCDFMSCQTSSFLYNSCDFISCQTSSICKNEVEPQGFTSQTGSNFHDSCCLMSAFTTTTTTTTTMESSIFCKNGHHDFTSQTASNIPENSGASSIKCKDEVESSHDFIPQTTSVCSGESNGYKNSRPLSEDGLMASKMAHVNLGSKLDTEETLIGDSIYCDGIMELDQGIRTKKNSPSSEDTQRSSNARDMNLQQSDRNLDGTLNDCAVAGVGDDHPTEPLLPIDDTFNHCLAVELQDLTSFDTLNQNVGNANVSDSSRIDDSCISALGTHCIFSNCFSGMISNLAAFPSPGDLYINYNQNLFDHGRLPPLVSLNTHRYGFRPQGPHQVHTRGIPLFCQSSSSQLMRITSPFTPPLPADQASLLSCNTFKQETMMNSSGNISHKDDSTSCSLVPHDLSSLQWKSPAAKTRAARKRRMAKNRLPNQEVPNVQPARIKQVERTSVFHMVASREKQTPTSKAKVHDHELLQKTGTDAKLRFLLQKELKPSDVGTLGRIVLPKRDAEAHLPDLTAREGITLLMEDIVDSRVWNLRFRFWPNNKSRMYLLENTRDFVKTHNLQEGDFLMIYKDDRTGKYVVQAKKVARLDNAADGGGRKAQRSSNVKEKRSKSAVSAHKDRANSHHQSVSRKNSTGKCSSQVFSPGKSSSQEPLVRKGSMQEFQESQPSLLNNLNTRENVTKIQIDDMNIEEIVELR